MNNIGWAERVYGPVAGFTSYAIALKRLNSLNHLLKSDGILMPSSLSSIDLLYEKLGRPLDNVPVVHVGGTNGKGTTCWKICKALMSCGLRTGLFVSPHISSFRERMQINGCLIPEDELVRLLQYIFKICIDHEIGVTLFEVTFALACLHFKDCDVVVLEVGLGGLLDATNVVATNLSILCSVSLDHTRILGSTVEEIATVKAGIFKENVPCLVGPHCPLSLLQKLASEAKAPYHEIHSAYDLLPEMNSGLNVLLNSENTKDSSIYNDELNGKIAAAALCILSSYEPSLRGALEQFFSASQETKLTSLLSRPPCRWEEHSVLVNAYPDGSLRSTPVRIRVIMDVAHNPAAVQSITHRIKWDLNKEETPLRVFFSMSRGKGLRECIEAVASTLPSDRVHFPHNPFWRAVKVEELHQVFREVKGTEAATFSSNKLEENIEHVFRMAAADVDYISSVEKKVENDIVPVVVAFGTGYFLPAVRKAVGIDEPNDDEDLLRLEL
jgi:dihydrofolate synthase/folylpolyglutamate synthase